MTSGRVADMTEARELIAEGLRAALPAETTVTTSGGAFDQGAIRRHVTEAPAVVVACLGFSAFERRGSGWSVTAQWAVYIVTRDLPGQPSRDVQALALASQTVELVSRALWGAPEAFELPEQDSIEASNLYSGDIDSIAAALWAVPWRQRVRLERQPALAPAGAGI